MISVEIIAGISCVSANGVGGMFGGASSGFTGAKSPAEDFGGERASAHGQRPPFKTREIYASIFIQFS